MPAAASHPDGVKTCAVIECSAVISTRYEFCPECWKLIPANLRTALRRYTRNTRLHDDAVLAAREEITARKEHPARYAQTCHCGKQFVFLKTARGRRIPVDLETVRDSDQLFDRERHTAHFATCSDPDRYRRPRR